VKCISGITKSDEAGDEERRLHDGRGCNWSKYDIHPQLLKALHAKGFHSPTPIQAEAIPFASAGRDVVGVAETVRVHLTYFIPVMVLTLTRRVLVKHSHTAFQFFITSCLNPGQLRLGGHSEPLS
jgi:superfamily II DNA/RNA helicase